MLGTILLHTFLSNLFFARFIYIVCVCVCCVYITAEIHSFDVWKVSKHAKSSDESTRMLCTALQTAYFKSSFSSNKHLQIKSQLIVKLGKLSILKWLCMSFCGCAVSFLMFIGECADDAKKIATQDTIRSTADNVVLSFDSWKFHGWTIWSFRNGTVLANLLCLLMYRFCHCYVSLVYFVSDLNA